MTNQPRCRCGHNQTDHTTNNTPGTLLDLQPCQTCPCPNYRALSTEPVPDPRNRL